MPTPEYRACSYCNEQFQPRTSDQRYCSRSHKERGRKKRREALEIRPCQECGTSFSRPYGYGRTKFCGDSCAVISFERQRTRGLFSLIARQITSEAGRNDTSYYLRAMRNDPCAFCGERDDASHLDHIVARESGGSNAWHNRTGLCSTCNGRKATHSLLAALARRRVLAEMAPMLDEYAIWSHGTIMLRWTPGMGGPSKA